MPGCTVSPETVFFHYGGPPAPANATRYIALSGARIFDAIPRKTISALLLCQSNYETLH